MGGAANQQIAVQIYTVVRRRYTGHCWCLFWFTGSVSLHERIPRVSQYADTKQKNLAGLTVAHNCFRGA